jgi:hypothetical protein
MPAAGELQIAENCAQVRMAARSRFCLIDGDRLTLARTDGRSSVNAQLCERVCLAPQSVRHLDWLNADLCPPCCFVARSMNFAVMSTAQGDRKLITHLSSEGSALCKSEVVRIGRTPAANQTRMSCDEFHVLSIADSSRLSVGKTARFDLFDSGSSSRFRPFPLKRRYVLAL